LMYTEEPIPADCKACMLVKIYLPYAVLTIKQCTKLCTTA
jgi:hypothetical protein